KTSGGLHGVGASVVNALSEWLEVTIFRDGHEFYQRFESGGKPIGSLEKRGASKQTGSIIHFKPDPAIFSTVTFDYEILSERLRESAFLLNNLKVELIDEREDIEEEYEYPDGLQSFINYLN